MEMVLYGFVGVMLFGFAAWCAWWLTTSAFPLDHRFSETVERSLPLQGRWLRKATRAVIFPVVLLCLAPGVAIATLVIVQVLFWIGALFTM